MRFYKNSRVSLVNKMIRAGYQSNKRNSHLTIKPVTVINGGKETFMKILLRPKRFYIFLMVMAALLPAMSIVRGVEKKEAPEEAGKVELFDAVQKGLVDVKLTTRSSMDSTISVTNKTKKPLVVDMPSAFAGVPVVAQFDGPRGFGGMGGAGMPGMGAAGMGGPGMGGAGARGGSSGGNQSVGGGMGGGGGGGRGGMGGGGWFVAPEKTVHENVRTVCLEHGKKEPRTHVKYMVVPIDSYTKNKTTQVLCQMLGDETIDHYALQAAVWNQENDLSFEEMAAKQVRTSTVTRPHSFFTPQQIAMGTQVIDLAKEHLAKVKQQEETENAKNNASDSSKKESVSEDKTIENLTEQLLN